MLSDQVLTHLQPARNSKSVRSAPAVSGWKSDNSWLNQNSLMDLIYTKFTSSLSVYWDSDHYTHTHTHCSADLMFESCNCTWCCSSSPQWIEGGHKQHQVKQNARLNLGQAFPTGAYCEWYHSTKYRQHSTVHHLFLQYVQYTVLVRRAKQQCCSIKYNCKFAKYSHGHLILQHFR